MHGIPVSGGKLGRNDSSSHLNLRFKGTLRILQTKEVTESFVIVRHNVSYFKNFEDIDTTSKYWRPIDGNHAPGDGYLPANGQILQMTTGKSHSINATGVENVLASRILGDWQDKNPAESVKYIFVVHKSVFDHYTEPQRFNYVYADFTKRKGVHRVQRSGKQTSMLRSSSMRLR
jgi:hypothetical protein